MLPPLRRLWRDKTALVTSTRKHRRPQERKHEHGNSEDERDYTHPSLLELCRRVGEEKDCGEQNSIREVLTGNTPGTAGLLLAVGSFRRRVGGFTAPPHLVKVGHKRMGIGVWTLDLCWNKRFPSRCRIHAPVFAGE